MRILKSIVCMHALITTLTPCEACATKNPLERMQNEEEQYIGRK